MLNYNAMGTAKHTSEGASTGLLRGPAGDILRLLQQQGPMTLKQLRDALGVRSLNGVREQLAGLQASSLVQASTVRRGAGRPAHVYALSEKAHALFPKGYDILLKLLLEELVVQAGRERAQVILDGVSARLAAEYGGLADGQALEQRLQALAQQYAAHGTPLTIVEQADVIALHEYSCPYYNVAQANNDVCGVEQRMLEQVLGRKVRLTQRMVDGHSGCRFVIDARLEQHELTEPSA